MTTTTALADQLAEQYDIDRAAAREAVDTYAGQLADDPDLYDDGALTDAGAEIVRDQFAADHATEPAPGTPGDDVEQVREQVRELTERARQLAAAETEALAQRDAAIRRALALGARVPDLVADAQLKDRSRIYQIRDGRR